MGPQKGVLWGLSAAQLAVRMKRKIRMFLACFCRIYCIFLFVPFFFPSRIKSKSLLDFPVSRIITVEHGSKIKVLCVGH